MFALSYIEVMTTRHTFGRGPSKYHSTNVWVQSSFRGKIFLLNLKFLETAAMLVGGRDHRT
jgi:hypothetical protein